MRPEEPGRRLLRQHVDLPLDRRREDLHRDQGRARRRRLPPDLDQPREPADHDPRGRPGRDDHRQRRADLELLVQPADRAVLSRLDRQPLPVPRLRRPAGERVGRRLEPRQRRRDHVPRVASRSAWRSTATSRPIRSTPASSTAASSRATTRRPGQIQNVGPVPLRGAKDRFDRTAPVLFSPADPRVLFFASQVLYKTTNGGETWETISPDLTREDPGTSRRASATSRTRTKREASRRHLLDRAVTARTPPRSGPAPTTA